MIETLTSLKAHLRDRLIGAIESGLLNTPYTVVSLRAVLGVHDGCEEVAVALEELDRMGITGPASAAWLRSVARVARRTPQPELVWSGPEVPGLHARDTRRVYEELLSSAKRTVLACSYVYFDGRRAFDVLAQRMDEQPDLAVILLLNIQRPRGDTSSPESLVRKFADRFWGKDWPGSSRPKVYYDPRSLDPKRPSGVLHAKAVVIDDEVVFVTSANFTEAALDRNIEIGMLHRDHAMAASVSRHFRVLIERNLLHPLPME